MRRMIGFAVSVVTAIASANAAEGSPKGRVLHVYKAERRMVLEVDGETVRAFKVALGGAPSGDKRRQGDNRTPEGEFYVAWKNRASAFHRFLGLSYPMPRHAERALAEGVITEAEARAIARAVKAKAQTPQNTRLGGWVGIHGGGAGSDWTLGCIAVSDEESELLFETMKVGDRIVVDP
jgi:murein L,D-transpeptidase YafK